MVEHRYSSTTHTCTTYSTVACSLCKVIHWCHFHCSDVQQEVPFIYFNGYCTDRLLIAVWRVSKPSTPPNAHKQTIIPQVTHALYAVFVRSSCSQSYRLRNPLQTISGEKWRNHPQKHACQTHMVTAGRPTSLSSFALIYKSNVGGFFFITSLWY